MQERAKRFEESRVISPSPADASVFIRFLTYAIEAPEIGSRYTELRGTRSSHLWRTRRRELQVFKSRRKVGRLVHNTAGNMRLFMHNEVGDTKAPPEYMSALAKGVSTRGLAGLLQSRISSRHITQLV